MRKTLIFIALLCLLGCDKVPAEICEPNEIFIVDSNQSIVYLDVIGDTSTLFISNYVEQGFLSLSDSNNKVIWQVDDLNDLKTISDDELNSIATFCILAPYKEDQQIYAYLIDRLLPLRFRLDDVYGREEIPCP